MGVGLDAFCGAFSDFGTFRVFDALDFVARACGSAKGCSRAVALDCLDERFFESI